jgi:para-nitrobenzyl esterase
VYPRSNRRVIEARKNVIILSHSGADTEAARELRRRILESPQAREAWLTVWFTKRPVLARYGQSSAPPGSLAKTRQKRKNSARFGVHLENPGLMEEGPLFGSADPPAVDSGDCAVVRNDRRLAMHPIDPRAIAALLLLAAGAIAPAQAQTNRTVKIDAGAVEGAVSGSVLSFKGIPYAAPPIGDRRWRAPQPVAPWVGARDATAFGHDCMQPSRPADSAGMALDEDCLVLNVWRPAALASGERLPVVVWIHGGGFAHGTSASAEFDGSAYARAGIVFVSFNYRLGRFGFFAHPALIAAREGRVGSFGLMDQLEALRWLKRNIAAFGGNPGQVTVMGESAGGISVMTLLTSAEAKGLFHRAVVLSGGGRAFLIGGSKLTGGTSRDPSVDQIGARFAQGLGIQGEGPDALEALRALPAKTLAGEPPGLGPIVDGEIVTATPEEILRRGEAAAMSMMIGTTTEDLALPVPLQNPFTTFGLDAAKARALYNADSKLQTGPLINVITVDMAMHEPARFVAKQMTQAGKTAWLYRFGYVAQSLRPKNTPAYHSSELPYLFDTLEARFGKDVTDQDRAAAKAFIGYVTNFVKSGDPNGSGLPTWSKFDPARSELMMFTPDDGPVMQGDPLKNRLDFIEQAAEARSERR